MTDARILAAASALLMLPAAGVTTAAIPTLNGTCPGALEIHADEGGPVYVNGRETQLKRFNDNYYEARDSDSGVTLSISRSTDGEVQLSYTGRGGANGACSVGAAPPSPSPSPAVGANAAQDVTCESRDNRTSGWRSRRLLMLMSTFDS